MKTTPRLSAKQVKFLQTVELQNRPVWIEMAHKQPTSLPHYVGYDFAYNWGFRSEGEAARWLENLQSRGLLTIEKTHFVRITDAGKQAIAAIAATLQEATTK